jgi:hypothetical protein
LLTNLLAKIVGIWAGAALVWALENPLEITGGPLPDAGRAWIVAAAAGIVVCVVNLARTTWRRRIAAIAAIPVFALIGGLGVNAAIGDTPTLGLTLGIASGERSAFPRSPVSPRRDPPPLSRFGSPGSHRPTCRRSAAAAPSTSPTPPPASKPARPGLPASRSPGQGCPSAAGDRHTDGAAGLP